jgi:hypothetical protein
MCDNLGTRLNNKYLRDNNSICRGHRTIPANAKEFLNTRIKDDWIRNIACVVTNQRNVAYTDYDIIERPDEVEEYYAILGGRDEEMLQKGKDLCGLDYIEDRTGARYYFLERNRQNAELLRYFTDNQEILPEPIDFGILQSLLLGYSDLSIALYALSNDVDQDVVKLKKTTSDRRFQKLVNTYIADYAPIIEYHRKFLEGYGASLLPD